ncbi:MAG: WS/DGAT domain-containing protein [Actinomycetota bacterium]|nr:WS/DGAT domain-containing protein [Actinomycetota bacterium]
MNDAEAIMWAVESDPFLRSDFMNLILLDSSPDHRRLRAATERVIAAYAPLRQRVVRPPLGLAPPVWADDGDFDLDYHMRRLAVPPPGTHRQLLDLAAVVAAPPLDRSRPLWEMTVVEGLEGGGAAVLQRVHHSLTDGMGGMKLLRTLLDRTASGPTGTEGPNPEVWRHPEIYNPAEEPTRSISGWPVTPEVDWPGRGTPLGGLAGAVAYRLGQGFSAARKGLEVAAGLPGLTSDELRGVADRASRTARSMADQVLVAGGALSPLLTGRSLARRYETLVLDLAAVRSAGRAMGGTRNGLFVAGVTGALGAYHERLGAPCEALRMAIPLSLRGGAGPMGGNHFAPARVVVPLTPKDPGKRLALTCRVLAGLSEEPGFDLAEPLAGLISLLPASLLAPALRAQAATVDFATSIVPGLRTERFLAGARVLASWPLGPRLGCAANLTLLTCGERLNLGINLDPVAVGDSKAFMECLEDSFAALLDVT